jgi:acyl carrier protein
MITDKKKLEKMIKEIIADRLDLDIKKIKKDAILRKDLGMDSFGAVELAYELKEKFGLEIPQEDFIKIQKVQDIVEYISNHVSER